MSTEQTSSEARLAPGGARDAKTSRAQDDPFNEVQRSVFLRWRASAINWKTEPDQPKAKYQEAAANTFYYR